MIWKLYFWIIAILLVIQLGFSIFDISNLALGDIRGSVEALMLTFGTYVYLFKKHLVTSTMWKIIFWYIVIAFTLDIVYPIFPQILEPVKILFQYNTVPESSKGILLIGILLSILIYLPAIYAIYKLGYGNKRTK